MKFRPGDRVKLVERLRKNMAYKHHKQFVDWEKRTGTVMSETHLGASVWWDGRKSVDRWPSNCLEKVE